MVGLINQHNHSTIRIMEKDLLLSDDNEKIAGALKSAIDADRTSAAKKQAKLGVAYYKGEHAIKDNRIFYLNDQDELVEDKFASNIRIPHQFFTEIVDQKVQYLLSLPMEYEIETEDDTFKEKLDEYYDDEFQLFLQEMLEGASQKGLEYAFARTTSEDKLAFQVADSLGVFFVYDDEDQPARLVRYYDEEITTNKKTQKVTYAELWTDKNVIFFKAIDNGAFKLVDSTPESPNPRPHVLAKSEKGELAGRDYGRLPFMSLENNKYKKTDLEPIKDLIDDYDLMNAFLSNNLQDFADAIYVVRGYMGDSLDKLRTNLKAKKTVSTGDDGGVDVKTVEIPVEGRKVKMEIDKENIYKFGMAFDSSQVGDGNITNIVIKSRYALLNMKANKAEVRLRVLLKWINEMVVADINRRNGSSYKPEDVKFTFTRETMANENDLVNNEKIEAETRQIIIETILAAAPKLDDDSVLQQICEQFDLDWEEVKKKLEEQEFTSGLGDEDESDEDEEIIVDEDEIVEDDPSKLNMGGVVFNTKK